MRLKVTLTVEFNESMLNEIKDISNCNNLGLLEYRNNNLIRPWQKSLTQTSSSLSFIVNPLMASTLNLIRRKIIESSI